MKETLEEAAEKEFPLLDTKWCRTGVCEEENLQLLGHRRSFIKGAKWQAERMYSDEDLKSAFFSGCQSERQIKPRIKSWEEFIEKFKKK